MSSLVIELEIPSHLPPQKNLGLRILLARTTAGLTQSELGDKLNLAANAVCRWERGLSIPDGLMIVAIAEAVGQKPECFRV